MGRCESAIASIGIRILLSDLLPQINETNFKLIKEMLKDGLLMMIMSFLMVHIKQFKIVCIATTIGQSLNGNLKLDVKNTSTEHP